LGGLGFKSSLITVRILSSVKALLKCSRNKAEFEQNFWNDDEDEIGELKGVRNEEKT
jgi:hypothetical protein